MTKPPKAKSILQARKAISTKEKKQPPKPKHAGHGYFQGGPLQLLEESFVNYLKVTGNRETFWDELKGKWLEKYPSNLTEEERARVLELKKRLHLDGLADDDSGEDANGEVERKNLQDDESSDEEPLISANASKRVHKGNLSQRKYRAMRQMALKRTEEENVLLAQAANFDKKIQKGWFNSRLTKERAKKAGGVWKGFERTLDKKVLGNRPRRMQAWRHYWSHPDHKPKIDAKYEELHGTEYDKDNWLKHHGAVAKMLWDVEPEEVREAIQQAVDEKYEDEMRQYEELQEANWENTEDPEVIQARREQLPALITQFVELACKLSHTSFSGVIVGGDTNPNHDENNIWTASISVGKTPGPNPERFDQWDPFGFTHHHVKSFVQFFLACSRMKKGLPAFPPTYSDESTAQPLGFSVPTPYTADISQTAGPSSAGPSSKRNKRREEEARSSDDGSSESSDDDYDQMDLQNSDDGHEVPTPPSTPKLQKNRRLGEYLQAELDVMDTKTRRLRLAELRKLDQAAFGIQNNMARKTWPETGLP
ncbi:hypothetical protein VKT23_018279 [Stygiomarasmius scandens]|uniref:Uncharacterized protein n=1 Tax=Marasmiellus scandens TaxID=2682957 RepID=A0ABR1IRK6_9AGAR